jgi:nucleoside 2-deoxyribosyltransferase
MGNDHIISDSNIPYRVRIGVTGHRLLVDNEKLAVKIREILNKRIFELYDEKSQRLIRSSLYTKLAFSIMTPMAEGADRLVTQEVLKFPDSTITVVMPLVKKDYIQDFTTKESRSQFEALLSMARRPITLKTQSLKEEFPEEKRDEARRQAYEDVGRYLVNHTDVLIAIWDGHESRGKGGTADVISYAKSKHHPVIILSTEAPYNTIIDKGYGLYANSIIRIEEINALSVSDEEQKSLSETVYINLFCTEKNTELSEETKISVREILIPFYIRASLIAKCNQKMYHYAGLITYFFAALAVMSVAAGILFFDNSPIAFLIEFFLLSVVFLVVFISDHQRAHRKWIENRYLAERIRSAIFFAACGIEVSPMYVPPYLGTSDDTCNWMEAVFTEIWNRLPMFTRCDRCHSIQMAKFVRMNWLEEQIKYHEDKSKNAEKISSLLEYGGMVVFVVALLAPILHLILFKPLNIFHILPFFGPYKEPLEQFLIFVALSLPALGAAIGGIRTHNEFSRLAKRSHNMKIAMTELDENFSQVSSPVQLESLLRKMEELMLLENQDWLTLMKFAKLETVA